MDADLGDDDALGADEYNDGDFASDEVAPEFNQKDSILFVIDARRAMCKPRTDGAPSFFSQALSCVQACMRDRILGGEHDLIGVLLFGTQKSKVPHGQQGFPHVYLLQELEEPSAASMRELGLIVTTEDAASGASAQHPFDSDAGGAGIGQDFGHVDAGTEVELANVLWVTSMLFNSAACKNTRRRLYIMTDDDNPCGTNAAARARALTRSRDLQDARVWVEPFFFAPDAATFDLSPASFWRELVGTVRDNYQGPPPLRDKADTEAGALVATAADGAVGLAEDRTASWVDSCVATAEGEVLDRVRRKAHRKRVTWSSELTIREGHALSFMMVSVVRPTPRPTAVKLEARTNEPLLSSTFTRCMAHGGVLERSDMYKGYNFGGKWVYFEPYEVGGFGKEGFDPGLVLLGFKDADRLKVYHNLGPSKFLEPSERIPGSTQAMAALVHAMDAKRKIALARMLKGKVGQPRLVALLPQRHEAHPISGATLMPCGLHVVVLPFAEDFRSVGKPEALVETDFSDEQLGAARSLVTRLTLPPHKSPLGTVSNPAAHAHFAYLQMLAVSVPGVEAEPTVDGTRPDHAWLAESQPEIDAFRQAFGLPDVESLAESSAKRQRTGSGPAAPKPATPESLAEWMQLHADGRLSALTNPMLKEFCKTHGLSTGGRKDDLLSRVHDFLQLAREQEAARAEGAPAPHAER